MTKPTAASPSPAPTLPWWRVKMVWVVLGGPLAVVIASIATAVIAWKHIDPVIAVTPSGTQRAGDDVTEPARPHDALAPALKARNHAASPRDREAPR